MCSNNDLALTDLQGYICGTDNCTPPAGVSSVLTSCPASYYLCPASFDYGCCRSGYGCATNGCYVTTPFTTTYALTETATDAGGQTTTATLTVTTVRTPTPPTALPATSDSGTVAKFIPTSVEKTPATAPPSSNNSGGGGLSTAQLGGIIGGAIAILLVVVAAALIVIRRLNHVADVVETAKTTSSGDRSKSTRPPGRPGMAQYGPLSPSEIDGIGCDPLMMSTPGDGSAGTPQTLDVHRRHRSDSDYSQPAVTPSGHTLFDAPRHPNTGRGPSEAVYFDIPAPVHNVPRRSSTSHSVDYYGNGQQHGRQWSRASELSDGSSDGAQGVNIRFIPAELDNAGGFIPELPSADDISLADRGRRRSGSSTVGGSTIGSPRPSLNNNQRESSSSVVAGALPSPAVTGNQPLDPVNESGEFTHGYYGPWDGQPGQTAAGLDINYYITPPVALRFKNRA